MSKLLQVHNTFDATVSRMLTQILSYHSGYSIDINRNIANKYSNFGKSSNKYPYLFWVLPIEGESDYKTMNEEINIELHLYDKMSTERNESIIFQMDKMKSIMNTFFTILKTAKNVSFGKVKFFSDTSNSNDNLKVLVCTFAINTKIDCSIDGFEPIYNVVDNVDNELATG